MVLICHLPSMRSCPVESVLVLVVSTAASMRVKSLLAFM